jgi:signal transduction histidine kinase
MGRLFWKLFAFTLAIQLLGMTGIAFSFWLHHSRPHEIVSLEAPAAQPGNTALPRPPDQPAAHRPAPPRHERILPPLNVLMAHILTGLLSAALLAWYFSKPIRSLRQALHSAAEGNLERRLAPTLGKRRDELYDLSRDFDHMAGRLQLLMDSQRQLLHIVSHELRSPLARMQAAIGLVRQNPDKLEAALDRIELENSRIDTLVGELLTLSRLDVGVGNLRTEEIHLGELLAEIIADAEFETSQAGPDIHFEDRAGDVAIMGQAELLGRAIENVVRNAIKYSPAGGLVGITAALSASRKEVLLAVRDHGPGVPETELGRIFEPFFRSQGSASTSGYGLGLAIAHRVISMHGGYILARNAEGGGLLVEIRLPVKIAPES